MKDKITIKNIIPTLKNKDQVWELLEAIDSLPLLKYTLLLLNQDEYIKDFGWWEIQFKNKEVYVNNQTEGDPMDIYDVHEDVRKMSQFNKDHRYP